MPNGPAWSEMFPGSRATPIVDGPKNDERLYDESPHGRLTCFDTATGKQRWNRNLLDEFETKNILYGRSGSPLIDGDRLYTQLGGERGSILCLNKYTGETIFLAESTNHPAGYGTPILFEHDNRPLIAAMDAKGLFVVDRQNGKLLFHVSHPARLDENISTPIYHDGKLFITNGAGSDSKLIRLIEKDGSLQAEEAWTNRLLANSHGGIVLRDGLLYGATNRRGGGFACIRFDDGKDVFLDRNITRGSFDTSTGTLGDLFFILTEFGEVVVAQAKEKQFDILIRHELSGGEQGQAYAHPVVHGNRFYARIGDTLHCLQWNLEH